MVFRERDCDVRVLRSRSLAKAGAATPLFATAQQVMVKKSSRPVKDAGFSAT